MMLPERWRLSNPVAPGALGPDGGAGYARIESVVVGSDCRLW